MRIIVFGASGFMGRRFLELLSSHSLVAVARDPSRVQSGVECFSYDAAAHISGLASFDIAIDFASHVSVDDFLNAPQQSFMQNLEIPMRNLKTLNAVGFKGRYLYVSTDRALARTSPLVSMNETVISNDPYGASKLFGELIINYAARLDGINPTVVRFPNLYGPFQTSKQFIPKIITQLKTNKHRIEVANLNGGRNYLFIDDAIDALNTYISNPVERREFSVSGEYINLTLVVDFITKHVEKNDTGKLLVIVTNSQAGRSIYTSPPESLEDCWFRKLYNWEPKIGFQTGIEKTLTCEGL